MTRFKAKQGWPRSTDIVTTSVYLATDSLALTLNGATKWPTAKELSKLGETRSGGTPAKTRQTWSGSTRQFGKPQRGPGIYEGTRGIRGDRKTTSRSVGKRFGFRVTRLNAERPPSYDSISNQMIDGRDDLSDAGHYFKCTLLAPCSRLLP